MANIIHGGKAFYGFDIGILMLDAKFPRIIGDVGNAKTWNFPVLYKVVEGAFPSKVVLDLNIDDIQPFVDAAIDLQSMGVRIITTSCGFLAMFQEALENKLDIPIFTSTLLLLPMLVKMFKKKILVLTANSQTLTEKHLFPVCGMISKDKYEILGTENWPNFTHFTVNNWDSVDIDICEKEILSILETKLTKKNTDYGAILLECTNMPPYSNSIRRKFHLPVYDFVNFTNFIHSTYCHNSF